MEFPFLGDHCSEKSCNRLDFLPLKCDACKSNFCTDHISYVKHSCPSSSQKNVQIPVCPLCNVPVPSPRGQTPDIAVGIHIDNDCNSDYGKNRRKVFANKCSTKGCKIKEIVSIKCNDCNLNFCLKHRHPVDHKCLGKEESLRQKRLNALSNKTTQCKNNGNNSNNFIHDQISEDEALARALQASLQDERPVQQSVRDKCTLS